tara:strand:+ start:4200 stop:5117 length:918 start_codon:yes stop_codon:yes gene_type:complete
MRIFVQGQWHTLPLQDVIGYVAEGIELNESDITQLSEMSDKDAGRLLRQLAARISKNRMSNAPREPLSDAIPRIINEYRKGCSVGKPGDCPECAHGALEAIAARIGLKPLPEPSSEPDEPFLKRFERAMRRESGFHTGGFVRNAKLKPGEVPVILSTPRPPDWPFEVTFRGTRSGRWSWPAPNYDWPKKDRTVVVNVDAPSLKDADYAELEKRVMAQMPEAFGVTYDQIIGRKGQRREKAYDAVVKARQAGKTEESLQTIFAKVAEIALGPIIEKAVNDLFADIDEESNGATWAAILAAYRKDEE